MAGVLGGDVARAKAWHAYDAAMGDVEGNTGGSTMVDMVRELEGRGYTGQFAVNQEAQLRCLTCQTNVDPESIKPDSFLRVEGASDPDDMAAVAAITCPNCSAKGTVVLKYGPEASPEDAHVLSAFGPGPTS